MADLSAMTLSCARWQDLVPAANALGAQLPPDIRARFVEVFSSYLTRYDLEGAFERLNNRTVAAILKEWDPSETPTPIESGERDGIRYRLYEAPEDSGEGRGELGSQGE